MSKLADLSKYTKEELIYYLKKMEFYLPKSETLSIKYLTLNKRFEDITKEIDDVLADTSIAIKQLKENKTFDQCIKVKELNEKYARLLRKQQKIEKELYKI